MRVESQPRKALSAWLWTDAESHRELQEVCEWRSDTDISGLWKDHFWMIQEGESEPQLYI